MSFEVLWEKSGAYKRFSGNVTAAEFLQSIHELQGDWRFDTIHFSINDFSEVINFSVTEADIRRFAAYGLGAAHTNPNIHVVIISRDEAINRLVSLYSSPSGHPYPLKIFSDLSQARAWLAAQDPIFVFNSCCKVMD